MLSFHQGEYHFVLQRRAPHIRQGGEISFPGGRHEEGLDKTLEQTALRETTEEMGIPPEAIEILGRLDTLVAPMGTIVDAFVGITSLAPSACQPNPEEVIEVLTLPVAYFVEHAPEQFHARVKVHPYYIDEQTGQEIVTFPAQDLDIPERYHQPWGNLKYRIPVYRTPKGVIWGITARLITDVVSKLHNNPHT